MAERGGGESGEAAQRRRRRSIAIALALAALVVAFYTATIVRLGPNALRKEVPPAAAAKQKVIKSPDDADCKRRGTC